MPMLALLLLHAVLSGSDAGLPTHPELAPMTPVMAQLRLRQDSLLQWQHGQDAGNGQARHALCLSQRVDGRWQLRHRISFGASPLH